MAFERLFGTAAKAEQPEPEESYRNEYKDQIANQVMQAILGSADDGEIDFEQEMQEEECNVMIPENRNKKVIPESPEVPEIERVNLQQTDIVNEGTVLSGGIKVKGSLILHGTVNGDAVVPDELFVCGGQIVGNVHAGKLSILQESKIKGNVTSDDTADINGVIEGNVKGESVIIREKGRVTGDIMCREVFIMAGATIESTVSTRLDQENTNPKVTQN